MEGWWCVRHGDALAWVEAPTAAAAVERSLELHPLGRLDRRCRRARRVPAGCVPGERRAARLHPRGAECGPGRAGVGAQARATPGQPSALTCFAVAVVLALGVVHDVSAETWRGLTVAPEEPLLAV